jgi:hypothetical protein
MIHNHWLSIAHHDSQPPDQHGSPWFTPTGTGSHWLSIAQHDSNPLAQHTIRDSQRLAQHSTTRFTATGTT